MHSPCYADTDKEERDFTAERGWKGVEKGCDSLQEPETYIEEAEIQLKEENQSTGSENKENITSKILINGCR
jgi:hypothetical protein